MFGADANRQLEDAYQRHYSASTREVDALRLDVRQCTYEIDFTAMEQENLRSGRRRAIRRMLAEKASSACGGSEGSQWEYRKPGDAPATTLAIAREGEGRKLQPNSMCSKYILKVMLDYDTRRFSVSWAPDATSTQAVIAIQDAVRNGFAPCLDHGELKLMYRDEEEDLCTLVGATLNDCLALCKGGTLRLVVDRVGPQVSDVTTVQTCTTSPSTSPRAFSINDEYDASWAIVQPPFDSIHGCSQASSLCELSPHNA